MNRIYMHFFNHYSDANPDGRNCFQYNFKENKYIDKCSQLIFSSTTITINVRAYKTLYKLYSYKLCTLIKLYKVIINY